MPRYLFETGGEDAGRLTTAVGVAGRRFPEIEIEHCYTYTADEGAAVRALWVCRAPSRVHLERWAAATLCGVVSLRRIDASPVPALNTNDDQRGAS